MLLRSGSCAEISPNPVSRELTSAGTSAHRRLFGNLPRSHLSMSELAIWHQFSHE